MATSKKPARRKAVQAPSSRRESHAEHEILRHDLKGLAEDLKEHRVETTEFRKEMRALIEKIHEKQNATDQVLSRYKGAMGAVTLVGSGIAAAVGTAVAYFKGN